MYKQAIVVRKDVEMGKGKIAAQVAHASNGASMKADRQVMQEWNQTGAKKVVLKIDNQKEMIELQNQAKRKGLATFLVKDAGKTQIESGTMTALGIGPGEESEIDEVTGHLKLL